MTVSLEQAREQLDQQAKRKAYTDMGLEYCARVSIPPSEDEELKAIVAREKEFRRDDRISARTCQIDQHIAEIDRQIDKLVYEAKITDVIVYEMGFLLLLRFYHLERIEIGDNNPLARDLLKFYHRLQ